MIPLEKDAMRDLLELKDIALLYELWTFFWLADEITAVPERSTRSIGRPGQRSLRDRFRSRRDLQVGVGCAPSVQRPLLQVAQETQAFLLRAATPRYRAFDP